jgi:hypothetical protein
MKNTTSHDYEQAHKTNTTTTKLPSHTKTKIKNGRYNNQTRDCLQFLCSTILHAKHSQTRPKDHCPTKSHMWAPKNTPNITMKLSYDQFGLNAHSLRTEYLTCIGKQLRNALNDLGRLGTIYIGLTNHILAKYGGSQHLPLLNKEACLDSPTARTLNLLKHNGLAHIQTEKETFPYNDIPLATIWFQKTTNHPNITTNLNYKYLHQLLLLNITTLEQITLLNGITIMNEKEFQQYHKKSTPTIKKAFKITSYIFCTSICADTCRTPCNIHQQSYTLLPKISNHSNQNFYHNPLPEKNPIIEIQEPPKPPEECKNYKTTPSPPSQTQNTPKEKINLAQPKCLHHTNAHGHNPKTKTTQCGWPLIKYSHITNQILPTII